MQQFKDQMAINMFGRSITESQGENICVTCGEEASEFTDTLSRNEYGISGMCQRCQDETFGPCLEGTVGDRSVSSPHSPSQRVQDRLFNGEDNEAELEMLDLAEEIWPGR
jgi:hypothetical protein|tara:strand:- start:9 stop:338 length:330 start_codon:yes stop_codon:yes gene_type:complete